LISLLGSGHLCKPRSWCFLVFSVHSLAEEGDLIVWVMCDAWLSPWWSQLRYQPHHNSPLDIGPLRVTHLHASSVLFLRYVLCPFIELLTLVLHFTRIRKSRYRVVYLVWLSWAKTLNSFWECHPPSRWNHLNVILWQIFLELSVGLDLLTYSIDLWCS